MSGIHLESPAPDPSDHPVAAKNLLRQEPEEDEDEEENEGSDKDDGDDDEGDEGYSE